MRDGRPKLPEKDLRKTFSITSKKEDLNWLKEKEITGAVVWEAGLVVIRKQVLQSERGEKFDEVWNTIYPRLIDLLPEKISSLSSKTGTVVDFNPISREKYLEDKKIGYKVVYESHGGIPPNSFKKVDLTPEFLFKTIKEDMSEVI
jgi:hypothetical protein